VVLLKVNNIEVLYRITPAVRGVSLGVDDGNVVALLGANGAGKSTILKTIMGLLEDQPDKGTIEFLGNRIDGRDTEAIVEMGISCVPEGRGVFPELTVWENLTMGGYRRRDRDALKTDSQGVIHYFPVLAERGNQLGGHLSGGEQQMLAIGRALMARPRLLMLDEPSLGLAPLLVREIFRIIRNINQGGTTILLVEQNARMALSIADYGYVLETGRIVLSDTSRELMLNEDIKEFYLGVRAEQSIKGFQRYKRKKRWR
jgi:branched-chain amino acid transport system ATP-binding protein